MLNPETSPDLPKRVLIADDDSIVRGSLAAVLESEGFIVDEAENGIKTSRTAIEHSPDLVLLDLNMPHWMAGQHSANWTGSRPCCRSSLSPPAESIQEGRGDGCRCLHEKH